MFFTSVSEQKAVIAVMEVIKLCIMSKPDEAFIMIYRFDRKFHGRSELEALCIKTLSDMVCSRIISHPTEACVIMDRIISLFAEASIEPLK